MEEPSAPTNSEESTKSKSEKNESGENEKSEEYLNFERTMKAILSIPPAEAREIVKRTPFPKSDKPEK